MSLERNPTLVQAGAQVRMSQGNALQAGLYPNPTVGYAADQIGAEGTVGEFQGMFVEQEFVTGGKLALSRSKYAQEARQAEIQVLAQRYRVLYSVRVAFYKVLLQEQRLQVEQELQANAAEIVKTLDELDNVGQARRPEAAEAKATVARRRLVRLAFGRPIAIASGATTSSPIAPAAAERCGCSP